MTIVLNHFIVPARDRGVSARFFADMMGLMVSPQEGRFIPVRVNADLTEMFTRVTPAS
ncbi:hypothetical protein [Chondromyces crocatus]|uniref:Glyoxalase n=1 Tax=Chondromyces crocatus TaxID=52 RepID=A0A0K1EPA3_CHOCO|nr:hypothetical protein [Chondromyces crocatus]AKT42487.1 uncharacterized protein CMC5_067130 [Chondromyces crocatus]